MQRKIVQSFYYEIRPVVVGAALDAEMGEGRGRVLRARHFDHIYHRHLTKQFRWGMSPAFSWRCVPCCCSNMMWRCFVTMRAYRIGSYESGFSVCVVFRIHAHASVKRCGAPSSDTFEGRSVLLQFGNFQEDRDLEVCMSDGGLDALEASEDSFDDVI